MKSVRNIIYLFLAVGALMLLGGVLLTVSAARFIARASSAPGTVIELRETRGGEGDTLYAPVVRYSPPGSGEITFVSSMASMPPAFSVGEAVQVLYAPGDPRDARIRSFGSLWFGPLVLTTMGLIFTGGGLGFVLYRRAGEKKKNYLMAYGNAIETQFQAVERNTSLEVNGRNPWRVASQWRNPVSGNVRVFHSENLWFDPGEYVKAGKITVLLDPEDERSYHMDVSFLPKLENS